MAQKFSLKSFCYRLLIIRGFLPILLALYIVFISVYPPGAQVPVAAPRAFTPHGEAFLPDAMEGGSKFDRLIVVACHAVLRVSEMADAKTSDHAWYLLDYQKNVGFPRVISRHIQKGLDELAEDSNSLLIFSGGETRGDVGPLSEAASYYYAAEGMHHGGMSSQIKHRIFLEEYARDSFENLFFAIIRFREVSGHYPRHVTVVGFDFKATRFTDLHRRALGYPAHAFDYVGLTSPSPFDQPAAETGEKNAMAAFQKDPYGCRGNLRSKRRGRDPFHRTIPYELSAPELVPLLEWCGPGLYQGAQSLPWARLPQSRRVVQLFRGVEE